MISIEECNLTSEIKLHFAVMIMIVMSMNDEDERDDLATHACEKDVPDMAPPLRRGWCSRASAPTPPTYRARRSGRGWWARWTGARRSYTTAATPCG